MSPQNEITNVVSNTEESVVEQEVMDVDNTDPVTLSDENAEQPTLSNENKVSEKVSGGKKIKERVSRKKIDKVINNDCENSNEDDENEYLQESLIEFTNDFDFTPIFNFIEKNELVSNEMKHITSELKQILSKKFVGYKKIETLVSRLVTYYKLNVSTIGLQTYDLKVKSDVENITKILKAFVLKNRTLIADYTRHVIAERRSSEPEFNTVVSAHELQVFDIFENVALNNLERNLTTAKTVFYDIYLSWVLVLIIAMNVHNSKYDMSLNSKKSVETVLKDKIVLLNTDTVIPVNKKLINVLKKEKQTSDKPKKTKSVITEKAKDAVKSLSKASGIRKNQKVKTQKMIEHNSTVDIVSDELNKMTVEPEKDIVQSGDLPLEDSF